jgi:hypothetical protein
MWKSNVKTIKSNVKTVDSETIGCRIIVSPSQWRSDRPSTSNGTGTQNTRTHPTAFTCPRLNFKPARFNDGRDKQASRPHKVTTAENRQGFAENDQDFWKQAQAKARQRLVNPPPIGACMCDVCCCFP